MNREQLILFFGGRGYKSYPIPRIESEGVVWTGSKRLPYGSTECDTNEHKISYQIKIWDWIFREVKQQCIDIEIVAEKHEQWCNLKSYGIRWDDIQKQLLVAEICLSNAWEAICRTKVAETISEDEI